MSSSATVTTWVAPRYTTPPASDDWTTRGGDVLGWCEQQLVVLKGPLAGHPYRPFAWQRFITERLYELKPDDTHRHRTGLVGVGRQNGKSLPSGGLALEALFRGPYGAEVYSAAGDRQQARIVFGEARKQVEASPQLSKVAKVYRDAIEVPSRGSVYRVLSADAKLQQGLSPYFVVFDEVHVQPDDQLWEALRYGMAARPDAIMLGLTTAGEHEDTLCGQLYEHGIDVAEGATTDDSFFFAWWEPAERQHPKTGQPVPCEVDDEEAWLEANPKLADGVLTYEEMRSTLLSSRAASFRRFRLNQWWTHGGKRWMDMEAWDACVMTPKLPKGKLPVVLTFDGSVDQDATALTVTRLDLDKPVEVTTWLWQRQPEDGEDWKVDRDAVRLAVTECYGKYNVKRFMADPAYWQSEIAQWQDEHGGERKVLEWPVTNARMGPACTEADKRIKEGDYGHSGNPLVRAHMRNAVTKPVAAGHVTIRKQRPDSEWKIDAAVTVVMGIDGWTRYASKRSTMGSV